ncbi:HD domain-containing protein [Tindallia magadiensis]|uniref:HD domain-containing protein n=1 Tax=Tindallia magadiensis TaxID=69895 RepID=A0A1I3C6G9_9FIRM|nr:HD domain-containing protein [Tindallia magadiensis]SFH69769.1 HD domain-containing protein [Tindallia magadiensis]
MISLTQLTNRLSRASDMVSPELNGHQQQVAYISWHIGKEIGLSPEKMNELYAASVLHDIGGLSMKERLNLLSFELINPHLHGEIGWLMLKDYPEFMKEAKIIRHHHVPWDYGRGKNSWGEEVPIESHIIHLADRITTSSMLDATALNQSKPIMNKMKSLKGSKFHPELVDVLEQLADKEYFWLDLHSVLKEKNCYCPPKPEDIKVEEGRLLPISKLFARVIDFRSRFTAVHSEGVSSVATTIASCLKLSENDCAEIEIAGYLHDIGKLTVPSEILDKPGDLTAEEYNVMKGHTYYGYILLKDLEGMERIKDYVSFHHEKMNGTGYPFKLTGEELPVGSRIMAVADILTALTENRPYRKGMTKDKALLILGRMAKEKELDPEVVQLAQDYYSEIRESRIKGQEEARSRYDNFASKIGEKVG